jgi:hypothetical protein
LSISSSTISANQASSTGGGLKNNQGNVTVSDSTISGNSATSGGGVWSDTNLSSQTTTIVNATISGNTATTSGGGLLNSDGRVVLRHDTITNNTAPSAGGGGAGSTGNSSTRTEVKSTIIAANTNSSIALVGGSTNSFQSNGYNLIGNGHSSNNPIGEFVEPGDQVGANPMLGPLANNGGTTFTHVLLTGSPAINLGDPAAVPGSGGVPQFDQRGNQRILVGRIDIGAVEIGPVLPGDYNRNQIVDAADYILWRKTQGTAVPHYVGADGNGDAMIDGADLMVWRQNFGNAAAGAGASASSPVAENEAYSFDITQSGGGAGATEKFASNSVNSQSEGQGSSVAGPAGFESPETGHVASSSVQRGGSLALDTNSTADLLLVLDTLFEEDDAELSTEAPRGFRAGDPAIETSTLDLLFHDMGSAYLPALGL